MQPEGGDQERDENPIDAHCHKSMTNGGFPRVR